LSITAPLPPHPTADAGPIALPLLLDIGRGLAAAEALWRPHAHHDAADRHPVRLIAADRWEAWVIGWSPGQHVELHDHGPSAGSLVVVEGQLDEIIDRNGRLVRRTLATGDAIELPTGIVHDVVATAPGPATSIHVYAPALEAMTFYDAFGRPARTTPVSDEAPVSDLRRIARALHPSTRRG
jgi:quercetin dioxygenase-like cupin family protein